MFKRYIDFLSNIFITQHQNSLKVDDWLYDATDRITVWLVSLSTGAVALLISYGGKIAVDKRAIVATIILFICSIITGIFSRITYLIASRLYKDLTSTFEFEMKIAQLQYFPREIDNSTPAALIYFYIKEDFDFNLETYTGIKSFEEFIEKFPDQKAQELYKAIHNYCKQEKDKALKEINKTINHTFGRLPDFTPPPPKKVSLKKAHFTLVLFRVLTVISLSTFVSALIVISINYIK